MTEQISPEAVYAAMQAYHGIGNPRAAMYCALSAALPHLRARNPYGDFCCEGVTRKGELQPCDKTAVALRYDPREEFAGEPPYAVCSYHARGDMMPLSELLSGATDD